MGYRIAAYMRLSKEDDYGHVESNSISMQRILLRDYAGEHFPGSEVAEFTDDGYTGTNFERPGMQALLSEVKEGRIDCIIVKDFSRFSRDYIELGSYLEQIFPFMGVRFISVNDGYDSESYKGSVADLDVNFKALLYDMYSKDLSVKVRSSVRTLKERGKFVGAATPFGYMKDPDDRHRLLVDREQAETVRKIFCMRNEGASSVGICSALNREKVKTPTQFLAEAGKLKREPKGGTFYWQTSMVLRILHNRVYCGDLVQGRQAVEGVNGRKKNMPACEHIIVSDCHEPIVSRELFDSVQATFHAPEKKNFREKHILSGFLACANCGRNMQWTSTGKDTFRCSSEKMFGIDGCPGNVDCGFILEELLTGIRTKAAERGKLEKITSRELETASGQLEALLGRKRLLQAELETAKRKRMEAYEEYAAGKRAGFDRDAGDTGRVQEKIVQLEVEIKAAEDRVMEIKQRRGPKGMEIDGLTRELIGEFVDHVAVRGKGDIEIIWK